MFTAKDIYTALFAGKKVKLMPLGPNDPELVKLLNHLNVMKSQSKKIYMALDLNWDNKVISTVPPLSEAVAGTEVTFLLTEPKPKKHYASFIIE